MSHTVASESKHSNMPAITMWLSMVTMALAFVVWSMVSPIAPQVQKLFGLPPFDKSLIVATPVLLGSVLRIPLGWLADRFGGRRVYTVLMLFVVVPLIGMTTAHSLSSLLAWEVLLGAAGASFAVAITHVSAWYPAEKQGLALGITAFGNIGTALAGFTVPSLFLALGYQKTFLVMIIPTLVGAILVWFFTRDPKAETTTAKARAPLPKSQLSTAPLKQKFWTNWKLWALALYYFITFGGFVAFGNYLPTLLQQQFHISAVSAGMRAAGFVVLATFMRPLGGYLADRLSPLALLLTTFLVLTAASLLFAAGLGNFTLITVAALTIAVMLGIGNGTVFKLVPYYFSGQTGKATGIVGAIGGIGGFFPPLIMGAIQQSTGSYAGGLYLLAATSALALLVVLTQLRTNRSQSVSI